MSGISKGKINIGTLSISGIDIPFNANDIYFKQTDTTLLSSQFLGKNNNFKFVSNNSNYTSFNVDKYTIPTAKLSYSGNVDNTISRNGELTVYWTIDSAKRNTKSVVALVGEDSITLKSKVVYKMCDINELSKSFNEADFYQLTNCSTFQLFYVIGSSEVETLGKKSIDFRVINQSWTRFFFQ